MRSSLRLLLALVSAVACGGSEPTKPSRVARLTLSSVSLQLQPGDTTRLMVRALDSAGDPLTVPPLTWRSSDPAIVSVSASGLVAAIAVGGPASVSATAEGVTVSASVTVLPAPVARLEFGVSSASVDVGDSLRVVATARDAAGRLLPGRTVEWSSSAPAVATVSTTGLITGILPGALTITAASEGIRATLPLTVVPAGVASITIEPSTAALTVGQSQVLHVVTRDKHGNALLREVTWASANPSVVSVSQAGRVTGLSLGGPVAVTATSGGKQTSAAITVRGIPVARLEIQAPATDVNAPVSMQLTAVATDAGGNVLSGRAAIWSSDAPQIATIDDAGVLRSVRAGSVRVRARIDSIETSIVVAIHGLMNRWTFSEEGGAGTSFRDDIGGLTASIVDVGELNAAALGGQVTLSGGDKSTADYVSLPRRLLSGYRDATIEVWATVHSLKRWSRVFDTGSGAANNVFIAWSQMSNALTDRSAFSVGGVEARVDNVLAPFTPDVQHHVVMAIDEDGGTNGLTRVSIYLDGLVRGYFDTSYRLRDLTDDYFWLGRSTHGDETAHASFDEVRVHDRVYPPNDIWQSFARGPVRTQNATSIVIGRPAGIRDTVRGVGVRFSLQAVAKDALGRQHPLTGARWTSSNPDVATVDSVGVVRTLREGRVEFSATFGALASRWTADVTRVRRVKVDPYLATPIGNALWEVPVVIVEYLPTADGAMLDVTKAPDFYELGPMALDSLERWTLTLAKRRKMMVEQGSRYRGYADPLARPGLGYRIIEHIIVYDQIPPHPTKRANIPGAPRYEGWHTVFAELQLESLMRARRVRELWVTWSGFDGNYPSYSPTRHRVEDMRAGWESNMVSPTGDVSNSDRDPGDAPILPHTYIIYGNNFRRSQAEAVHNVGHQLEAMMSYVASRQDGTDRLFWRDFVGQNTAREFTGGRVGWTHMPPNTIRDYDYLNSALISSDIEDWRPDNSGKRKLVNVDTWGMLRFPWPGEQDFSQRVESQWYIYWMQHFPGVGNRIPHGGRWMTNWWAFVADWDAALASGLGLHGPATAAIRGDGTLRPNSEAASYAPRVHVEAPPIRRRRE